MGPGTEEGEERKERVKTQQLQNTSSKLVGEAALRQGTAQQISKEKIVDEKCQQIKPHAII